MDSGLRRNDGQGGERSGDRILPILLDVLRERAQAAEDSLVVGIVRAQLEPVALRYRERELERVDRIEAEIAAEQGRIGLDRFGFDPVDIETRHDELGELVLGR